MNSREHPCPDCRYPRRVDEDFCPTCPFAKTMAKEKPAFSFLFDWEESAPKKQPQPTEPGYVQPQQPVVIEPAHASRLSDPAKQHAPAFIPEIVPEQEPVRLTRPPARGTFNPYLQRVEETPKFSLTLVPRHTEATGSQESFEGESIILNRNNLDKENYTISGQEHAIVEYVDGKWLLNNRSNLKTTYIQVNAPTELKEGDVILLGDRMFIFRKD